MTTYNQLLKYAKQKKRKRDRRLALAKCPQKKGIVKKLYITTPKKPNSGLRKVAKVWLTSNHKRIIVNIPGRKHNLQKFSTVLVRGGRVRDLPGVRYRLVRNKYDLCPVFHRTDARSKYGIRKFKR